MHQPGLGELEPLPFLADAVLGRHPDVLEGELVRSIGADHRDLRQRQPRRRLLDDEGRDVAALLLAAGAGEDDAPVRLAGAGDPDLGAVQHVVVAVAHRPGLDRARRVGAARGLGDRHEGLVAVRHHRVGVLGDLRLAALVDDVRRIEAEGAAGGDVGTHPALRRLLGDHALRQQVQPGAAVLGRGLDVPEPELARLGLQSVQDVGREGVGVVLELVLLGQDPLLHEAPRGLAQHPELLGHLPGAKRPARIQSRIHPVIHLPPACRDSASHPRARQLPHYRPIAADLSI